MNKEGILAQMITDDVLSTNGELLTQDYYWILVFRFIINLLALMMLITFMYSKNGKSKDFNFSYFAIGMTVFMLCFMLQNVQLELGFALGLFAIFGIIRYRTDAIPIKEMTYLFVVIGVSVINALANLTVGYAALIAINATIVIGVWALEKLLSLKKEHSMCIIYEKIENIHLDKEVELKQDIATRTGLNVTRYEVTDIDYLKDIANIVIYFDNYKNGSAEYGSDYIRQ